MLVGRGGERKEGKNWRGRETLKEERPRLRSCWTGKMNWRAHLHYESLIYLVAATISWLINSIPHWGRGKLLYGIGTSNVFKMQMRIELISGRNCTEHKARKSRNWRSSRKRLFSDLLGPIQYLIYWLPWSKIQSWVLFITPRFSLKVNVSSLALKSEQNNYLSMK